MAKYHGKIGFIVPKEVRPGVWQDVPVEREAYGEFVEARANTQNADKISKNISMSGRLNVLMDQFAMTNFQHIRYATYMGAAWSISSVRPAYPKLQLTLGEIWNGQRPDET